MNEDELASLFQTVSLSDEMYFKKLVRSSRDELTCSDSSLSVDESNLVIKALELMRTKTGIKDYYRVHLEKIVPMQAGLGGGSANAATTMHAFNKLSGNPVDNESLRNFGGEIGSDISFFFSSGTAFCTGRGEHITSLPPLPKSSEVIIDIFKINEGLSTAKVFQTLDLNSLNDLSPTILLDSFSKMGILAASMDGKLINDLQVPALISSPTLRSFMDALKRIPIFELVTMSGSGTALCCFRKKADNDESSKVQTHINTLYKEFPGLQHFQCFPIVKSDTADSWYL